ncbi:MAG: PH domain-containing protein [Ruaniaceae bacterium]|nr:PH domain-containing protein [Ruaniaceae bacterium]
MTEPQLGDSQVEGAASSVPPDDSDQWRKVHWSTPLVNAWQALAAVIVIVLFNSADWVGDVAEAFELPPVAIIALIVAGAVLLFSAVALVYSYFAWRRIRYAVSDDAVYYHSGIFLRSQRHARLNRIQGVDINRPVLGRLVGIAAVVIESAGGAESKVDVKFLKDDDAEALRAEILARAAGLSARQESGEAAPAFAVAPERVVYQLEPKTLIGSLLRSGTFYVCVVLAASIIPVALIVQSFSALVGFIPVVAVGASFIWSRFAGEFGFTLAISPDGLRTRQGLLSTRAKTLPPGRIQAISLTQPYLWRRKDWWRVRINVAGYGLDASGGGDAGSMSIGGVLIPVATRSEALNGIWLVLHDLGVDDPQGVIDSALSGTLGDGGFLHSPRQARWVDPIKWRRNGLLITRTALLMRSGRITRSLAIVPHERTQSLRIDQGPWARKLGVAAFAVDSVTGPVVPRVEHLLEMTALQVLREQSWRAREARALEGRDEWMLRVGMRAPEVPGERP